MTPENENSPNNSIPERYQPTARIWENLIRFWAGNPEIPIWAIASNFYFGVRKEYNRELLAIIDGGGDAHSRINALRKLITD